MPNDEKSEAEKSPVDGTAVDPGASSEAKSLDDSALEEVAGGIGGMLGLPQPNLMRGFPLPNTINPLGAIGIKGMAACTCSNMPSDPGRIV